jgi:hypothetical protein
MDSLTRQFKDLSHESDAKKELVKIIRQNETLEQEIIDAPTPGILNLFSRTKETKKKELKDNKLRMRSISLNYKRFLMNKIKDDEKIVNSMINSPIALKKATADMNKTMNFVENEMSLFGQYLDLTPENDYSSLPSSSTGLDMNDAGDLERMAIHRKEIKSSFQKAERSKEQQIKESRNKAEIQLLKEQSRGFKYRLNNFEYVLINNGFFKGEYAKPISYNSKNRTLQVKTVLNNKLIPLIQSEYMFLKDINSRSPDNFVKPQYVNHNSIATDFRPIRVNRMELDDEPSYTPPSPTSYNQESDSDSEDEEDDLDNKSDFGYEEEEPEFKMETTFEQDVMAARNLSNEESTTQKIRYSKIISDIIQLLKLNEDNINPFDLADIAISTYIRYNLKDTIKSSAFLLDIYLATIVFTHLNGSSLVPSEVYTKCRLLDWSTPEYLSCVLDENKFFDNNKTNCLDTISCINKMLMKIDFTSAPISSPPMKISLKQSEILYPVSRPRQNYRQPTRDISRQRGGPGKTRFITLPEVENDPTSRIIQGRSGKRRRSENNEAITLDKRVKTIKTPTLRQTRTPTSEETNYRLIDEKRRLAQGLSDDEDSVESRFGNLSITSPECAGCGANRYRRDDGLKKKWRTYVCSKDCPTHSGDSKPVSSTRVFKPLYSKMILADLRKIAKQKNVINFSKMKKSELVSILDTLN